MRLLAFGVQIDGSVALRFGGRSVQPTNKRVSEIKLQQQYINHKLKVSQ